MKKSILATLMLSLTAGCLMCGTTSYAKTEDDKIVQGVYVDEVNVSGMNKEEAKEGSLPEPVAQ